MLHLRLVVPPELAPRTLDTLTAAAAVCNIVHFPGASRQPDGDLVLADVAREDASIILSDLRRLGLEREGAVMVSEIDTALSDRARRAEKAASGSPADAVVWEMVESRTSESAELSFSFLSFMALATMIAAVGILTDSQILIIGAMIVGPEFGPLAGFCVAAVERRPSLARRSLTALAAGFPLAIVAALLLTLALRLAGQALDELSAVSRPTTTFISEPNAYSVLVAVLAGVAGMLSLSTAKSGALIGVLVSVTTIPAAGNIGVATAYGDWGEVGGATAQLLLNLAFIMVAGVATLGLQRSRFLRRRCAHSRLPARRAEGADPPP